MNLNAPQHARIRTLIARAFTARRIAGLEPAIVTMADELLDAMADRGADGSAVEFMHDFAYLLPVTVICELIGIPEADREGFRPLARDLAGVFEITTRGATARDQRRRRRAARLLHQRWPPRRRAEPRDDLLSDLLAVADPGDGRLTDAELLHNLTLLLVAGFETTTNLLGNGLQIVLHDPPAGAGASADGSVPARRSSRRCCASTPPSSSPAASATTRPSATCPWSRETRRSHAARRGQQGPAPVRRPGQVRPAARRRRPAQLRRRSALLHRSRARQAGGRGSLPPAAAPVPGDRGRRPASPPGRILLRGFDTLPITVA